MTADASGARARAPQTRTKDDLRRELRSRRQRSVLTGGDRTSRALALCAGSQVVACYLSLPPEPDTHDLVDALVAGGTRVLVPVLRSRPDWAWYGGAAELRQGWRGIPEPTSATLGPDALAEAQWIWVSGLAATARGDRLGTGGGWYDRALEYASDDARIGVLLHDGEVLDWLPTDPWDRRVEVILTTSATLWVKE